MNRLLFLLSGFFLIVLFSSFAGAQGTDAPGKKLFLDNKCNMCHSISAASIEKKNTSAKGTDLSNVGGTRTAEWITKWLNKTEALDGKNHMVSVKLNETDLKTLVDWLATLKTAAK